MNKECLVDAISQNECLALISPNMAHYFYINDDIIEPKTIKLSQSLENVKRVLCDPFGQYVLFVEETAIYILYLECSFCSTLRKFGKSKYDIKKIDIAYENVNIQCVKFHPRISSCFFVLLSNGSFLHFNPMIQLSHINEISLQLDSWPDVKPISFSFGCDYSSDQYTFYISYDNGFIGMIPTFPILNYSTSSQEFSFLWNESSSQFKEWLKTWEKKEQIEYTAKATAVDIIIVNKNNEIHSIKDSEIIVERIDKDILLIEQICDNSSIQLYCRSIYDDITETSLTHLASYSTESLHITAIHHDVTPYTFILINDKIVYSFYLDWVPSFLTKPTITNPSIASILKHSYSSMNENTVIMNTTFHGHCILHLYQENNLKLLKIIHLQEVQPLHLNESSHKGKRFYSKELMQETEKLKMYMKVDVFKEYIKQLSNQPITDVSIDNGTVIDIIEQYQLPYIRQFERMKLAIQQTSSQIEEGIEKSEEYRKDLSERVDLINEENEKQLVQVTDLLHYQCDLDRHFERVIYKLQNMLNFEEKMTDQFYSSIEELLTKVQKAQEHLRQATNILISVECIQKSIQENEHENENEKKNENENENENVNEEAAIVTTPVIDSLKTVQQNLINAKKQEKQLASLIREYDEINKYAKLVEVVHQ